LRPLKKRRPGARNGSLAVSLVYLCAHCKLFKLEDSHGSIPNDGLVRVQRFAECLDGIWSDVKPIQPSGMPDASTTCKSYNS